MKEKYLIALDLDGTLLTDKKQIAPTSKKVIQYLIEEGHIVVIATGRANRSSNNYYHELGLKTPLINSNGALIHHPLDKNWGTYHLPLQHDTAMEIIDISYSFNSKNILASVQDHVYLDRYDEHITQFYNQQVEDESFFIGKIKERLQHGPTGMLLYPDENNLVALTKQLNELKTEIVDHRNWGDPFHIIEVMNKQMNKSEALNKVADYYHIPNNRIMAFGDGRNDLEMIENAGIGVAMKNAVDELKALAKYNTTTNEEHGVASFLTEYFNIKFPIVS